MTLSAPERIRYANLLDEALRTSNAQRAQECLKEALLILEGARQKLSPSACR